MESATVSPPELGPVDSSAVRIGSNPMVVGGVAFIGYAIWFLIRNFTDDFLELGIGSEQVDIGKTQIEQFSPSLYDYVSHLHIGFDTIATWG